MRMKRLSIFTALFFAFLGLSVTAAEKPDSVDVSGNVLDSFSRQYLDSIRVRLYTQDHATLLLDTLCTDALYTIKDSTQREMAAKYWPKVYRLRYAFKIPAGNYVICFDRRGYTQEEQALNIPAKRYGRRTEEWTMKDVFLQRKFVRNLGEAEVTSTRIKMMMKGDTVVYNADAFQVAEGSMLDGLIEMMPGLEIRDGGKIYHNGEYVPELLVNGKDFFKGDPAIALQNLPAYTVKDLRIYHKAPDGTYLRKGLTHQDTLQWDKALDVRLKRQYNTGFLANVEAALGPAYGNGDTRLNYLGRLFGIRYTDHSRLGFFANLNNYNDLSSADAQGSWQESSFMSGVTRTSIAGFNLNIEGKKTKVEYDGQLQFQHNKTESESVTSSTTFALSGDAFNRSRNTSTSKNLQIDFNNGIRCMKPKYMWGVQPNFLYAHRNRDADVFSALFNGDPMDATRGASLDSIFLSPTSPRLQQMLVNRLRNTTTSRSDTWISNLSAFTYFNSPWTGNTVSANANVRYNHRSSTSFDIYDLRYNGTAPDDYRHRYTLQPTWDFDASAALYYYGQTPAEWFKYHFSYSYDHNSSENDKTLYRLERADSTALEVLPSMSGWKEQAIDLDNTFHSKQRDNTHHIVPLLVFSSKGNTWTAEVGTDIQFAGRYYADTRAENRSVSRHYTFLDPRVRLSYSYVPRSQKGKAEPQKGDISLNYSLQHSTPEGQHLLNVRDVTDPLRHYYGNPNLQSSYQHQVLLNLWQHSDNGFYNVNLSYNRQMRSVAQAMSYNATTGLYIYRPENINGNYNANASLRLGFTPKEKPFSCVVNPSANYYHSVDLISPDGIQDAQRSVVNNVTASLNVRPQYTKGKITAFLQGNLDYNYATSQRPGYHTRSTFDIHYTFSFTAKEFWKGLIAGTELTMYHRRGYDDHSMNDNHLLWNANLSRSFGKDKAWTLKLVGYDLLHQFSNVQRTLNAQGLTETWVNSLPAYAMLHVIYKFNKRNKSQAQ